LLYVVYTDGDYYYAENGATGELDYGGPSSEGGATGTNASQVIQATLDAARAANGGLILVKNGIYNISTTLNIYDRTRLLGIGRGNWISGTLDQDFTTFVLASGVNGISIIGTGMVHLNDEPIRNVEIGHINIRGTKDQYAFVGYYFRELYIHDLEITKCDIAFWFTTGATVDTFAHLTVKRVLINDMGGGGIDSHIRAGAGILFENLVLSGGVDFQLCDCRFASFFNCTIGSTSKIALYEVGWDMFGLYVENCHFEGMGGIIGVDVYGTGGHDIANIHIEDCEFFDMDAGVPCIQLDDVSNAYVEHNKLGGDTNIIITNTCSDVMIVRNTFKTTAITDNGTNTRYADNSNFITENSGTATILAANTSIATAHGCDYTPTAADIRVVLTNLPTADIGDVWLSAIGAANFTINCRNAPGAATAIFAWRVNHL